MKTQKGKWSVEQFKSKIADYKSATPARIAAKLSQPTALDPVPTNESATLRAAAGLASKYQHGLRKVARFYNLSRHGKWDLEAARKMVESI